MKKHTLFLLGMLAVLLTFGMVLSGCSTTGPYEVKEVQWSDYTKHPSKDYTVVGVIILRPSDTRTIYADLMEKAVEMGAHDIINVHLDVEPGKPGSQIGQKTWGATAVAIKYTDKTLTTETVKTVSDKGETVETTGDVLADKGLTGVSQSGGSKPRKKFLGIF